MAVWAASAPAAAPHRVSLRELARHYGYGQPRNRSDAWTLKSRYSTLRFTTGSRRLVFNETLILMNDALTTGKHGGSIAAVDMADVVDPLLRPQDTLRGTRTGLVVLDPGHGGRDGGNVANGLTEKTLTLDIAKRVAGKLVAAGVPVRLTRYGDHTLSLHERVRRAKRWDATLFISIHVNSARNSGATGVETFVVPAAGYRSTAAKTSDSRKYSGNRYNRQNTILAHDVQSQLLASIPGTDRGVKRARFVVIRDAPCPATLVECGFASNRDEAKRLAQAAHRDKIATGITKGILSYFDRVKKAGAGK